MRLTVRKYACRDCPGMCQINTTNIPRDCVDPDYKYELLSNVVDCFYLQTHRAKAGWFETSDSIKDISKCRDMDCPHLSYPECHLDTFCPNKKDG